VVERLPSKRKALGSVPSSEKKEKRKNNNHSLLSQQEKKIPNASKAEGD